jgi:hypothetical protein
VRPRPVSADESDVAGLRSGTMPAGRQRSRRQRVSSVGVQSPLPSLVVGRPLHLPNGKLTSRQPPSPVGCSRNKALLRVVNIFCGLHYSPQVRLSRATLARLIRMCCHSATLQPACVLHLRRQRHAMLLDVERRSQCRAGQPVLM